MASGASGGVWGSLGSLEASGRVWGRLEASGGVWRRLVESGASE